MKMTTTTSSMAVFGIGGEEIGQMKQQQQPPLLNPAMAAAAAAPVKKKRNLPGTPYPDAEVVALSPKTLMATNRFLCEVCGKGFQREQNLQLHRRGHNLPWKLKQRNPRDAARRKVYLCPEPTCVHHDPSRALGDLTGIKKHFSRKHGEKKWKCDKCSKRYAVQSDWKAHAKTCGTREYRCDCGTLFSRRDSFITHRAFCDALAQETARLPTTLAAFSSGPLAPPRQIFDHHLLPQSAPSPFFSINELHHDLQPIANAAHQNLFNLNSSMMFDQFNNSSSSTSNEQQQQQQQQPNATLFANLYSSSMQQQQQQQHHHHQESAPPQMSATALLQKAAQMGATTSGGNSSSFAMFCNMNESKFRQAEEMTRDFLGVGSMLRMSQREQMGSSAAELGKSFAGGSLQ